MSPKIEPRNYQINARDQIIARIDDGIKKIICYLPTGMGKTLISIMVIEYLLDNKYLNEDDKILFLVADRKLKHQLHDMASKEGLGNYGNLFILPEGHDYPAHLCRQHAAMSKFIFATPVLFLNSIIAKSRATQKLERRIVCDIKMVVIDEVLDVLAQSYGRKRTRAETIEYIKKIFECDDYPALIEEINIKYGVPREKVEYVLIKEFSPKFYRVNKRFETVLSLLGILDPDSKLITLGLTASISQQKKREFLIEVLGGKDRVAEVFPEGEDFENYRPSINLRKIRVIDDFILEIDNLIQEIKNGATKNLKNAYRDATGNEYFPLDRVLLFVTELISKKDLKESIKKRLISKNMSPDQVKSTISFYYSVASAYLLITVARQKLLEDTFFEFYRFMKKIKNHYLLGNKEFQAILDRVQQYYSDLKSNKIIVSEKDKKLIYWVKRLANDGKKILVMCRFINMVRHLHEIINDPDICGVKALMVVGKMDGSEQYTTINKFKNDPDYPVLIASERLIEKGTDLPQTDVAIYYGSTISLERYEQSLGRIRSSSKNIKTAYTISYNLTVEAEKSAKRDAAFIELMQRGSKKNILVTLETGELKP
ncbi:MAG: DEAD/DEAH box helicase family protein [Promethearchaeota archaeon]